MYNSIFCILIALSIQAQHTFFTQGGEGGKADVI